MSKTRIQLLALIVGVAGVSTTQGAPPPNHNNNPAPNHEHHNGFGGASFFSAAKQFAVHHYEQWKANQNNRGEEWKANPNNHVEPFTGPGIYHFGDPKPATTKAASTATNLPKNSSTTAGTIPSALGNKLANIGAASPSSPGSGSKHNGSNSGTANYGQGNALMNSEEHIERALRHLSEARSAIRAGQDKTAQYEIHDAIRQTEEAVAQNGHAEKNSTPNTAVASLSTSKLGSSSSSKLASMPASSSPSAQNSNGNVGSEGHHEHPHIHEAVGHLREAERQIKEGHSGRAELDVHDAFVQLTEALRDRRRQ